MEPPSLLFLNIALQMKALEPGTAAVLLAIGVLLVCSAAMSASEVALSSDGIAWHGHNDRP